MSFYTQKTRENLIKTLFKAIFHKLWSFVSATRTRFVTISLAALFLTASLSLIASAVLAQNERSFKPETESLHVFPSVVESDSWYNINTIVVQDLSEDALFQEFTESNSTYIDPDGALPADVTPETTAPTTDETTADETSSDSLDDETVDSPTTTVDGAATSSDGNTATSAEETADEEVFTDGKETTTSTSTDTVQNDEAAGENTTTESVASGTGSEEASEEALDEDTESEDTPQEDPEPVSEVPADDDAEGEEETDSADESLLQSLVPKRDEVTAFFKRVTDRFAFTQAVSTTPATSTEPEELQEADVPANETATSGPAATSTVPEDEAAGGDVSTTTPATTTETDTAEDTPDTATSSPSAPSPTANDTPTTSPEGDAPAQTYSITLEDFGVPSLESGQFIDNLQLRLSLGGRYDVDASSSLPSLSASYSFGAFAGDGGSILVEEEISNAVNGGYYLIPLPSISDPSLLSDLSITLTFNGDIERLEGLFIDAAWLEVGTVVYDTQKLKQRSAPGQLKHLRGPERMELLSDTLDFTRNETPRFSMRYNSQRNFIVRGVRSILGQDLAEVRNVRLLHGGTSPVPVTPDVTVTPEGLITVILSEDDAAKLQPGEYTLEVEVAEGSYVSTDSFDFQWGILSINPDQTEYEMGEVAELAMGALSPNGNTLCNALLDLYIINPRGFISKEPVVQSGQCNGNNVVDVPDYTAQFVTGVVGEYEMYLERLDEEGNVIGHTSDTFEVVSNQQIAIERTGPTRIYPPAPYAMELTVHAKRSSFNGQLVERVPRDFDVFNTDATINRYADFTELVWDVSMLASSSETVSYEFDAPDLSPFLYELGPAQLVADANERSAPNAPAVATTSSLDTATDTASASPAVMEDAATSSESDDVAFLEHRQWQIASDATGNMVLYWDGSGAIPSGWTCLSCGSGTFYQRFAVGSSTYNITGGAATHTPTVSTSLLASPDATVEAGSGGPAIVTHSHTFTPAVGGASNLPQYRQLRVIQYTGGAGEPANIPAGAIGVFDSASTSLPTNWNRYAVHDGSYVYGGDAPGTTGGSNTHTHSISGTTGGSTGGTARSRGGGTQTTAATDGHTHTVSSTTPTISGEPPYVEVLLAKLTATSAPPNNLITMWTEDVPSGWTDLSSDPGDPFNDRFIKASTTYGATGGANSHTHDDMNGITSSGPSATISGRTGSSGAAPDHAHDINATNFSNESNLPPYVSVVYGKRLGTGPIFDQLSYRWYVNDDTQTPTDPWPSGGTDLVENEPITATSSPVKNNEVVRLRLNAQVTNATATAGTQLKLQYAEGNNCNAVSWADVGGTGSSTPWRGHDNDSVSDHSTLSSTTLSTTTIEQTYEENGVATSTPNDIPIGDVGEWDFVLEHNGASPGSNYCFRLVQDDGSPLFAYTQYPTLRTNAAPAAPTLSVLFDNEKIPTTTPVFEFVTTDPESNNVHYEIEVDDDFDFGSTVIDKNTTNDSTQFENQVVPADKAPFNQGELIRFTTQTALSNGTTYWWRVRARDPDGSNDWGEWSSPRSFTVDTALTASAWFQTTDEQFETNTLVAATTTGLDSVDVDSGATPDVSILDAFATGNTRTISDGSGRLLVVGIHSGDSGTNVDVNTVTYGGQTLTEVHDEQITTSFSNGMWVGYLDEAGIEAATGNTITPTWNGGTPDSAVLYSSVVLENVNQTNPVPDWSANSNSNVSTIQPTSSIPVSDGDRALYFTVSGLSGETHTPAAGYTEGTEEDSGSVAANAHKAITANGTEQPTADWTNLQNRLAIVALNVAKNTSGTMISTPIDFDDGTLGTAWGSLEWNDTETSGDISYQVQYRTDASTWALVPDSVLSGNSAGFDTSPVSLLDLDTDTYNELRLVANLTYSGGSPVLADWTVNWDFRVETPTISKLFPNEKAGTTTPTFEFTTTDPQSDDLTYQVSWSTDNTFASGSTTRTSDTDNGFINADSGVDTDPFNSGDTVQFSMQPADALSDNTTYWWRVRAKDSSGSNAYSFWTEPRSFTVDSTVVVSTWFQTTQEQFDTNILSGTQALASDAVAVATTADEALVVYGEGTQSAPRYRQWNGSSWTSEGSMQDVGAPLKWARIEAGTTREEYVAATVGTDNDVNAQVFSTGEWTNLQEMTTSMGNINARGFDVAYESTSGDAMVAYCDGDPDPSYSIWDGSSWTAGGTINLAETTDCEWIQLASDPQSNEIIILARGSDGNPYEAQVWNGSTWGNSTTLGSVFEAAHEGMTVEYEESGGQAIVIASDGNPARFTYDIWNGTTWAGAATQNLGDDFEWGQLVRDFGSDEMALCYQDEDTNIGMVRWTGSAWAGQTELLTTTGKSKVDPGFSCVFEEGGARDNYIMTAFTDTTQTNYSFWDNAAWSAGAQIDTLGDTITSRLERTGAGLILGLFFDETNDSLRFSNWDGSSWSTTETLEDNMSVDTTPYGHPYALAPRNSGRSGTTIVSPGINFDDGTGPYWDTMSWIDTTPGTSDILYSVQYFDSASSSWKFIPDSDLPGNEAGTSTGPIDLSGLDVNTYDLIRPYASLSCDGSDNCPTLQDWTVEWAEGITISGTLHQYDQTSSTTSGTVAVAVNGVLQLGKTGSVSNGVWSIPNVTTFAGDIVTVFVDNAADSNEAVGVTRYDGSGNITGMELFERHLGLGSDDATSTPLSNADVAGYNNSNDEDAFIGLTGSTLNVCASGACTDAELFINTGTTFAPGGDVVTHDIENNGTLTATTTLSLSGSWDNNATTTLNDSTVVFEATSTSETVDETGAVSPSFNNVTFGTTTGSATWTLATALDVNGDLTVSRGTLDRGTQPITVAGSLTNGTNGQWSGIGTTTFDGSGTSNWADQNGTLQNVGRVVVDGSSKTILLSGNVAAESITIGADDTLDVSGSNHDITVYSDWKNDNTFAARSGEVVFASTGSGNTITAGGNAFFDLTFNGVGGDWSFTESTLAVNNDFTVATGTVTMPTATTTLAGSFDAVTGTFAHNNSVIHFTATGAETIAASGTAFTNAFYDMRFDGSGSWTFIDENATSSNDITVEQGSVVFPSGALSFAGDLRDTGGSWDPNNGTVRFTGATGSIEAGGSSFYDLTAAGTALSFVDANTTVLNDLTFLSGSNTLPSGTLTLGGSFSNSATVNANGGEVLFNSDDAGETIDTGGNDLYDMTFSGVGGGWTIQSDATTTNNFTLATSSDFTLASGQALSVGALFINSVGGASTTWNGSTLSLENGSYGINSKDDPGDSYDTLRIDSAADVSMWHSQATTTEVVSGGSLYSQDHAGVDGDLYIYGDYERSSGTEHWSYATDFDGSDLSGGGERQVDVRFAGGSSASLTDSTFELLGSTSASTTVANQGSGSYTIDISGGTTTAQFYDLADLGSSGLSLLDGAVVNTLRDGSFTVAAAGGTSLTLSSTTIDTNPAKQIYNVRFATTTAISATNVTQTDGAPGSYWWFRDSSGNLDGEAFDNDTGNPGSVRWDDSALVVTISGTVYSDDGDTELTGGTCDGVATPVRVVVEGGSSYDGSCSNADGSYSISGVTVVGDPTITVYLNGASGGERAAAVTKTLTADVTDMDLYANRVIVRHEDTDAMTIDDMAVFDSNNDPDLRFTAATGTTDTLDVFAGNELHLWASTTFTPGGTVTLHGDSAGNDHDGTLHIGADATFTGAGTTTYTFGGSFDMEAGGSFVPASSTVIMNATTTGKTLNTAAGETIDLHALQFTGVGGGWNINGNASTTADIYVATGTVTGTGNLTIDGGSFYGDGLVSLGGGFVVIENTNTLGGVQGWTFNDLTLGDGAVSGTTTPASTATTTVAGTLSIASGHFLDAGASSWNLSGSGTVFVEDGTFVEDTSRVTYSGAAATNITSTDYHDLAFDALAGAPTYTATGLGIQVFGDLSVGASGTTTVDFDSNDPALNVDGDMNIGTLGNFIASDSGNFTLAGSFDNDGAFTGSAGTLTFDGVGTHSIAAGASSFSSVEINGTGDFTVSEHATATDAWTLTAANSVTVSSGQTLAVGGTFDNGVGGAATVWTNSTLSLYGGGNYEINASTTADSYATLSVAADTQIRMWNSDAATTTVAPTGSLYSMDHANTDGDLYMYGVYERTSGTDHWSYATDFDGTDLSGGAERKVDVFIENGASILYSSGAGLSVNGSASASTTLQNQGSGSYALTIGDNASTTMQFYSVTDIDANGLLFTGAPTVANISDGHFVVANDNDSAITVGGSVIDANPAKTFTRNRFATSSGVTTAVNVTATGTSVSSWRFTNHYGDVDGESFDSDPDGDPGYIVWDDSAANITVSGNVYSDEGSTVSAVCDGSTVNVTLVVEGLTSTSTHCDGSTGAYSISNIAFSPGDSLIVYIDGEAQKGAAVTVDPVSSINDMDVYENRVILRHENTSPITIADLADWEDSDDPDVPFDAVDGAPDTLTLPIDHKLIIWTGKEFEPGGNVTLSGGGAGASYDGTLELYDNAAWTSASGESHSIGGSLISGSGATFDAADTTFTFTTSAASRTIDTNDAAFANLTFNGTGSWTVANTILDVDALTITQGALTLPAGTTTISGTLNNSGGSFDANGGVMVFTAGAAESIITGGSDIATLIIDAVGSLFMQDTNATATGPVTVEAGTLSLPSGSFSVGGDFRNEGGSFTHNTSELIFTATTSAILLASSSDLSSVTFNGGGSYTMEDQSLTLLDTLSISAGSVTLATGTLSIGGSFDAAGGTFDHASGTILFNSSDTGETIDPGASDFYNVNIANGSGGWTITDHATTSNNFTLSLASDFTLGSGATLSVEGVFTNNVGGAATTWSGSTLRLDSGTQYSINSTSTSENYETLIIGANTDVSAWNAQATTTTVDSSGSFYSQDHGGVDGSLYIFGDYHIGTTTAHWSYATDFDGTDLSGGSERPVTVAIASGATTTLDGGTLNMVGESTNETLVTNQGSGQYAFAVSGGTFNAQHYQYRNLNADGLSLSGTPTITSLDNGDFELAVDGGSLISLSSTTLNANASLVISGMRFATTSAITGTNVDLSGTTANAWTFTGHSGNLDGEDFDNDGGTACGQLRWDDSSCLLTQQTHYRWRNDDGGINVPNSEWFDADWDARKRVRIENSDNSAYTDAAIELTVSYDADMQADFEDLRFTDDSGTTTIPYFIASTTNGVSAEVWVQVPNIPAQDTATVFMYYDNSLATTTSSSTEVFVAADDFEDGTITEYSGDTSLFAVDGSFAYGGSNGLDNTGNENAKASDGIARFDQTVSQGEIIRYMQYIDTNDGSGDEVCTLFGVQSPVTANQNYAVCLEQFGTDRVSLVRDAENTDSTGTLLASTTVTYVTGWYEIEVDWQTDDSIAVALYDESGTLVATTSATDSTYSSGGFGYTYWFNYGGWDNFSSRPRVENEPTVRFGAEQGDGGASWAAARDTTAGDFTVGDVARVRIAVENTGLSVTDAYRLEYAEQGGAPSCEAVDNTDFASVEPLSSCGSDPVCMATSTNVANNTDTTDLLFGTEGDFTTGRFIEDPSNTTASLTIDQNEYTELEYALKVNANVSDPNLCFRVSDAGSDLDTYLKVAKMEVRFEPTFGPVSFNSGEDISLVGGTTTRVYATSTVTDLNGYADLESATATMYTTGATAACSDNANDCYISAGAPSCTFDDCSGNSCVLSCFADFQYHATPTASDPGEEWFAFLEAVDQQGDSGFNTSPGIELFELRSIDAVDSINYGSLEVNQDTGSTNASTSIENIGNVPVDVSVDGTDLTDGGSSNIPANQQIFSTSTFTYSACAGCFSVPTTTPVTVEMDLGKPVTASSTVEDEIFWGIAIPFGVASNPHSGTNNFTPVNDN